MNAEQSLILMRRQKDDFFKHQPQSPLTPEQQKTFSGLRYYDYNAELDLVTTVTPFAKQDEFIMQTSSGQQKQYTRYGEFTFTVDGEEVRLTIYEAPFGFFLPFTDANAGAETYGAGRYVEPEQLDGDTFHIDLNQVYNPYCAYNDGWNCPITPVENRLKVAIRAGEMLPQGEWVEE